MNPARLRFKSAAALVVVLLGVLLWYVAQPSYDGRTAREWFQEALQSDGMPTASMGGPQVETSSFLE